MLFTQKDLKDIYKKASLCREFEKKVFKKVQNKNIPIPVYLSAGQEYIAATFSKILEKFNVTEKQIFIQHRGHSIYLSFGAVLEELIYELLGSSKGCANGMGGSASIQSKKINLYGHDGLMGSHGPIAVGACFGNKKFTICFVGDAAAEEDYFLTAIGWAVTKKLPIWFIVEDNNLSILTEKKVRRSWEMHDVAAAFGAKSFNCSDDPEMIGELVNESLLKETCLFNINTNRLFWHAGAGIDDPKIEDRHSIYIEKFGDISQNFSKLINDAWLKCQKNL